ncbi:MAG TPA: M20/M25/M40 family metallo-hydrolase [Planctomycetota bacterium]|nr:M20/M25/M40 family metallo-hydrolase [Planctomycetota bacterium]
MIDRAFLLLLLLLPQSDPTLDAILKEERSNSHVMEYLEHLTGKIGPRLTGSTRLTQACEWTRSEFEKLGLEARLEEWGTFPVGYDRGTWSAKMTAPEEQELTIGFAAWSPGTQGPVDGPAILSPETDDDLKAVKEKLKGAWVIATARGPQKYQVALDEAGIAGVIRTEGGEFIHTDGRYRIEWEKLPTRVVVTMLGSQHKKIVGLLKDGREVRLTLDIHAEFRQGPIKLYNVIAELPGSEKPEEKVIVGGHIDSWDGATGATDNGTGVATTLEAARLLTKAGAKPRRTIRFMLWSGEEQGLLGSRAYLKAHPQENSTISAVIVHDGGTNYASGINATEAMLPIFEKAFEPLKNLDPEMPFQIKKVAGLPQGIGSDHDSYLASGVPGFFWQQAGRAKYGFGHHTQNDTIALAIPEYQRHTSMVVAIGALQLANLPDMVPRQGLTVKGTKRRTLGVQLDADMEIQEVVKDSLADKSGIKAGDRLLKLNGIQMGDTIMLSQALQSTQKEFKLVLKRDGKEQELTLTWPD